MQKADISNSVGRSRGLRRLPSDALFCVLEFTTTWMLPKQTPRSLKGTSKPAVPWYLFLSVSHGFQVSRPPASSVGHSIIPHTHRDQFGLETRLVGFQLLNHQRAAAIKACFCIVELWCWVVPRKPRIKQELWPFMTVLQRNESGAVRKADFKQKYWRKHRRDQQQQDTTDTAPSTNTEPHSHFTGVLFCVLIWSWISLQNQTVNWFPHKLTNLDECAGKGAGDPL